MNFNSKSSLHTFILQGFGSTKYKTPLQGTVGSVAASLFAACLSIFVEPFWIWFTLSTFLTWLGLKTLRTYKNRHDIRGEFDPSWITIDEWCGIFAGCSAISFFLGEFDMTSHTLNLLLFRYFDMAKPFAIFRSQDWGENFGVFADDLLAGIMSGVITVIIYQG